MTYPCSSEITNAIGLNLKERVQSIELVKEGYSGTYTEYYTYILLSIYEHAKT